MESPEEEKQCRICLEGPESQAQLGRLVRPCLCRGSIRHVHIKCLQRWRTSSANETAFFECPQCHYRYRFARTSAFGIATNPIIVGALSSFLFTLLVLCSSYIATYFMSAFDEESTSTSSWFFSGYFISPIDVGHDLIRAAFRILTDQNGILDEGIFGRTFSRPSPISDSPLHLKKPPPGLIKRLIHRFIIGLPVVGAGSLVHMLLSVHMLAPVQWIARYRGSRNRRDNSRDIAALVIIVLLIFGAARALYKVYDLTQKLTKRILLSAENAILEVN